MKLKKDHRGVGMIEVLVALLLLAIGVLGYVALQVRAVDASSEALTRSQAMLILRGLAENIRANDAGQTSYPAAVRGYTGYTSSTTAPTNCMNSACTPAQMATFDAFQAARTANALGIAITMNICPGVASTVVTKRQCLFAAWGNTTITATSTSANYSNCMSSAGIYENSATCLMMEAY